MVWLNPYVINGAAHSAALFRRQAQRPASANSGVAEPTDLAVTKLPSAGPGFRIMPGSLSLKSGYSGRSRESYGVENGDSAIDITGVEGTGSAARRDAIVVEVLDPNYMPITHEEAALENYTRVHVVQNVLAGAKNIKGVPGFTNRTAYVLAFINWPKEQTSIQASYIENARELANPRWEPKTVNFAATGSDIEIVKNTVAYPAGGQTWPLQAEVAQKLLLLIPEWATHMSIDLTMYGIGSPGGNASGHLWVRVGANTGVYVSTQTTNWDTENVAGWSRLSLGMADTIPVPVAFRGTVQQFRPRVNRLAGTDATAVRVDAASSFALRVMFEQHAI